MTKPLTPSPCSADDTSPFTSSNTAVTNVPKTACNATSISLSVVPLPQTSTTAWLTSSSTASSFRSPSVVHTILSALFAPLPSISRLHTHTFGYWLTYFALVLPIRSVSFVSLPVFLLSCLRLFRRSSTISVFDNRVRIPIPSILSATALPLWLRYVIFAWMGMESLFWLYYIQKKGTLQMARSPASLSKENRKILFNRCRKAIRDHHVFLSRWFFNVEASQLKHDDVERWMAWAFFARSPTHLSPDEKLELNSMMHDIQEEIGRKLEAGESGHACVRNTFDPVTSISRPLVYYVTIATAETVLAVGIRAYGYQLKNVGCMNYYVSEPKVRNPNKPPIVFVHGIGAGIGPYLLMLRSFTTKYAHDRTIIIPSLAHISMQIAATIPNREETLWALDTIFATHHITHATIIGHSLGTVILSWLIQHRRELVHRAIFIDPVVFMLWEVDVAYNFLYRQPKDAVDILMYYFVSKELYISTYLHRHFWWYENVLFPEQLPSSSVAFISGSDSIIAPDVHNYLLEQKVESHLWEGLKHGEFQFSQSAINGVMDVIDRPDNIDEKTT